MGNIFRYYVLLVKRWVWMLLLGVIVCSSATYLVSTFLRPVYQASAFLIVDLGSSTPDGIAESQTLAHLMTTPVVLTPVVEQHAGMSMADLTAMLAVKPQADAQIIELDVQAQNPYLASELANQVSQSFARYANHQVAGSVQAIPAQVPALPSQKHVLLDATLGGGTGLALCLLLLLFFAWQMRRATSAAQIQALLGAEIIAQVPRFSRRTRTFGTRQVTTDNYQMISASLNMAQATQHFKLVTFTSALAGEGKSTIISNVARHLALSGKQVLLVDLNIHCPTLAEFFHLEKRAGLTDLLTLKGRPRALEAYTRATELPGLHVLTSGTQAMSSAELLQALVMAQFFPRLKQSQFDYVLLDVPPLFAVAETRVLLSSVEAFVLVVNGSGVSRKVLERTSQFLQRTQTARMLGVIVNQSSWHNPADARSSRPAQSPPQSELQFMVEQVTMEVPTVPMSFLVPPESHYGSGTAYLPDTGESELVVAPRERAEYVIRPSLSLNGLALPTNGLTRRSFRSENSPDTPPTF